MVSVMEKSCIWFSIKVQDLNEQCWGGCFKLLIQILSFDAKLYVAKMSKDALLFLAGFFQIGGNRPAERAAASKWTC